MSRDEGPKKRGHRSTERGHNELPPRRLPLPGRRSDAVKTPPVVEVSTVDEEMPLPQEATAISLPPFVEVELVYEKGGTGTLDHAQWRAMEIWTRNRIYGVDWNMSCIEVIDRDKNQNDLKHPLLGARLAGGQAREQGTMELTYPCPRP